MSTLREFAGLMRDRAYALEANVDSFQRGVARSVLRQLAQATPVDTGRMLSNWTVSIDVPSTQYLPEARFIGHKGSTRIQNLAAVLAVGYGEILKFNSDHNQAIHITNYTPYIMLVDQGGIGRKPRDFIQPAFEAGVQEVRAAGFKLFDLKRTEYGAE